MPPSNDASSSLWNHPCLLPTTQREEDLARQQRRKGKQRGRTIQRVRFVQDRCVSPQDLLAFCIPKQSRFIRNANFRQQTRYRGSIVETCLLWCRRRRCTWILFWSLSVLALAQGFAVQTLSPLEKELGKDITKVTDAFGNENKVVNATKKQQQHVRFISPLLKYGYPPAVAEFQDGTLQEKPLLLYLPGFDGTFLSPFLQFPELHTIFDVRCMTVGVEDRSTIEDLKGYVMDFIRGAVVVTTTEAPPPPPEEEEEEEEPQSTNATESTKSKTEPQSPKKSRPFYLAGESFGGILACDVALDVCQDESLSLRGLALINPATCYYRSRLAIEGPVVAASHPLLYYFNLIRLLPLFTDEYSLDQLIMILGAEALPSVIDNAVREAYLGRVAFSLPTVLPVMKQETLQWRLSEWLEKGSALVDSKLEQLATMESLRMLLVVGENDGTLPSIDEAERLAGIFRSNQLTIHVVEGAGHASTCGSRVDLAALFRQAFPRLRRQPRKKNLEKPGLRWPPWRKTNTTVAKTFKPRTEMKPVAAKGKGKWFGMEPRYDNATIGLSPLKYWSSAYYQKVEYPPSRANVRKR